MMTVKADVVVGRSAGMTLSDVEAFCAQARTAGATGAESVSGQIRFSGAMKELSLSVLLSLATKDDVR